MPSDQIECPNALATASRPCGWCGGTQHTIFPDNGFDKAEGSYSFYFDVVVCRHCRKTTLFTRSLTRMEQNLPHMIVNAKPQG